MHKLFNDNLVRFTIVLVFLLALQTDGAMAQKAKSGGGCPKVGVVLSGGGAKGAAHIGVLKYMEEIGIPVQYVAGTSMGSIVGGMYALGYSPEELEEIISGINWALYITGKMDRSMLSQRRRELGEPLLLNIPYGKFLRSDDVRKLALPMGANEGDNLLNMFNCLSVGFQDSISFDSLPIPFACVATDLMTGSPKVLRSGEFAQALRSSMAIPIFFTPVEWDKGLLVDGGVVNNFPVDVCKQMGADVVIGLEVVSDLVSNPEDMRSIGNQLQQYLSIVTNRGLEEHRGACDIYIRPDVSGTNMLSFNAEAIADLVRRGYEEAKKHEEEFMALKERLCSGSAPRQSPKRARMLRFEDTLVIDRVSYESKDETEKRFVEKVMEDIVGVPVTLGQVEEKIHVMQGLGLFHRVNYSTIPDDDGHYVLKVWTTPELPNRLGYGLRYDSEENATMLIHASWNALKLSGWNAWINLGLKYNWFLDAHLGWLWGGVGEVGLDIHRHKAVFRCLNRDQMAMDMHECWFRLGVSTVHSPIANMMFGIEQGLNSRTSDIDDSKMKASTTGLYFRIKLDSKNEKVFATKGLLLKAGASMKQETEGLFGDGGKMLDMDMSAEWYFSTGNRMTLIPRAYARAVVGYDDDELWYNNLAGGMMQGRYLSHQMPFVGMKNTIELGPQAAEVSFEARYRVMKKVYLGLHGAMLGHRCHDGEGMTNVKGYELGGYFGYAVSVSYSSILGPVMLLLGSNSYDDKGLLYLSIGFDF